MGNTSSQSSPLMPQRVVPSVAASPSAKHGPHYSPEFDDFAASQQLLDEANRSGNTNRSPTLQVTLGEASRKVSRSPPLRQSHLQRPTQDHDSVQVPSDDIDVSKSQPESLPPPTPSTGVPRTKSSGKKKKNLYAEVDVHNILPKKTLLEQGNDKMTTPSALRSRRKRKHVDSTEAVSPNQTKLAGSGSTTHKKARREPRSNPTAKSTEDPGNIAQDASTEMELSRHEQESTHTALKPNSLPQYSPNDSNEDTGLAKVDNVEQEEGNENDLLLPAAVENRTNAHRPSRFTSINDCSPSKIEANGNGNDDYNDGKSEPEGASPDVGIGSNMETTTALDNDGNNDHTDDKTPTKTNTGLRNPAKKASAKPTSARKPRKMAHKTKEKGQSDAHSTESKPIVMSAAEIALNTERKLNSEPDVRSEGPFTNDEEERIRRAILSYQERKGLDIHDLVEIIQLRSESQGVWKTSHEREQLGEQSRQFWSEIQQLCPKRATHNFRTQVRARYHLYKSGTWSEEEDEQLRKLTQAYPNQWSLIYQMMPTRSPPSIQNRWRDYVQYGDTRTTQKWSEEDEELFIHAVSIAAQRCEDERAAAGKPPITNYTRSDIDWKVVCAEMGKARNRIQCAEHWEVMSARPTAPPIRVEIKARKSHQSEESVHESPQKRKQPSKARTPAKPQTKAPSKKRERRRPQAKADENASQVSSNKQALLVAAADTLDVNHMRIGDKVNLLTAIINGQYEAEENIDWQRVFDTMEQAWPVGTLQAGWKDLVGLVDEKQEFSKILDDILEHLADNHGDEWDDCYVPLQGADAN